MIVVVGSMTFDRRDRLRALAIFKEVAAASRQEPGCAVYAVSADIDDDVFRVIEEWESREHLAAHLATPHIGTFMAAMVDVRVLDTQIVQYEVRTRRRLL